MKKVVILAVLLISLSLCMAACASEDVAGRSPLDYIPAGVPTPPKNVCGNKIVEKYPITSGGSTVTVQERCDDANMDDSDSCPNDCAVTVIRN